MPKKLTQADFIARAKEAHGNRYDYSLVAYTGSDDKVTIICPVHGAFEQIARGHLKTSGCRACTGLAPITTTSFIAKAREAHGNRYDYSKSKCALGGNNRSKVTITCPEHGDFEQSAASHLKGTGCPACWKARRNPAKITTTSFIAKAREAHGNRYDYSKSVYLVSGAKLTITCPEHGDFEQVAYSHLNGTGCWKCAGTAPLTTADFIAKAREAHGNRYDYSKSVYLVSGAKLTITCPEHGDFEQSAAAHLVGRGCWPCGKRTAAVSHLYTTADFIAKAREAHGNRYDYSKTDYSHGADSVTIICPVHGAFEQIPVYHIGGHGCWACAGTAPLTTADFIAKAREAHGNRYDYSKSVYLVSGAKLTITCPEHGDFEQTGGSHIQGTGCPACAREKNKAVMRLGWIEQAATRVATLYFVRIFNKEEEFYKVGITINAMSRRFAKHALPGYNYEILALHKSGNPAAVWDWERSILETFAHLRYRPKRHFEGQTECFSSCEEILEIFPL